MYSLDSAGYVYQESLRIWKRSDYGGIAYSDGDETELRIGHIIQQAVDISVLSSELGRHCTDWPSLYHLGPHRSNILRPVEACLKGRVLEIGAGCGAISRYLGEIGSTLLSLEGSPRRASIAASRTRDLANVTVLAERFDDFRLEEKFDAITLIGVLEYAAMFSAGESPALDMLCRVRNMLAPGGRLFIAIENKLGLKYYAGAPEDHMMAPMYGIEDRYTHGQPRTFGRREFERLLRSAGFSSSEFCAPFPDYKLPRTIITEAGFQDPTFDAFALIVDTISLDPQLPNQCHFELARGWRPIVENGLGLDMANSFLSIAALDSVSPALEADTLAYHYRTDRAQFARKAQFFKRTKADAAKLTVETVPIEADGVRLDAAHRAYAPGASVSFTMGDLLSSSHWTIPEAGTLVRRYVNAIMGLAGLPTTATPSAELEIPGKFANATFDNVILGSEGTVSLIGASLDGEEKIEIGSLAWRSLIDLLGKELGWRDPIDSPSITYLDFALAAMREAGLMINTHQATRYTAQSAQWHDSIDMRFDSLGRSWRANDRLDQSARASETVIRLLRRELDEERHASHELRSTVASMQASRSWLITAPLRRAGNMLRRKRDMKKDAPT